MQSKATIVVNIESLLKRLRRERVQIRLENRDLVVSFDGESLPEDLQRELRANKAEIVRLLEDEAARRQRSALSIRPTERRTHYAASATQKRFFFLQQSDAASSSYNIPLVFDLDVNTDVEKVCHALEEVFERHELLKSSYEVIDGEIVCRIRRDVKLEIQRIPAADDKTIVADTLLAPFSLGTPPLIRVAIIEFDERPSILAIVIHHIIADGISSRLILKELAALHMGRALNPLRLRYRDYTTWRTAYGATAAGKWDKRFWATELSKGVPRLSLPVDYPHSATGSMDGDRVQFVFDGELATRVRQFCKQQEATLFMFLLAAYCILLSKACDTEEVVVGTGVSGRFVPDLLEVVGLFFNTIPLINYPRADKPFARFLEELKTRVLRALEHQTYDLDEIVDCARAQGSVPEDKEGTLFNSMFSLQNYGLASNQLTPGFGKWTTIGGQREPNSARFDLFLIAVEYEGEIRFLFEYRTALFARATIERLGEDYADIVRQILIEPTRKIMDFETKLRNTNVVNRVDMKSVLDFGF